MIRVRRIARVLLLDPREERLLVDEDAPPYTADHPIEAVLLREEYEVAKAACRRPRVVVVPLGERDKALVGAIRVLCGIILHRGTLSEAARITTIRSAIRVYRCA